MPLNINENDEVPKREEGDPAPITRAPADRAPLFTTATLLVLLGAIVAAGVYLMMQFRVIDIGALSSNPPAASPPPAALANPWKTADSVRAGNERTAAEATGGRFALYINSFRERGDAEEEVSRWSAAGFSSFVADAGGWHRVAFGRYSSISEALRDAERWKQAFENGYWIGTID